MSRIPELMDDSASALRLWWKQMAEAGLAFHPDENGFDIGNYVGSEWVRTLTDEEAEEVNKIVKATHTTHGDLIYAAALQATETPEVTAAREHALNHWNDTDVQISPYAEVEKVDGGFWVGARVWVPEE